VVKRVFRYLCDTIEDCLYYWLTILNLALTNVPSPFLHTCTYDVQIHKSTPMQAIGHVDSERAGDSKHRRSISGMCLCFTSAPVDYRFRFQHDISHSWTKAELIVAVEADKLALYLQSLLQALSITQIDDTKLYEDNTAAVAIAKAKATRPTRHMDIKNFYRLDSVSSDQLILSAISTHDNPADGLTKSFGSQLFP